MPILTQVDKDFMNLVLVYWDAASVDDLYGELSRQWDKDPARELRMKSSRQNADKVKKEIKEWLDQGVVRGELCLMGDDLTYAVVYHER